MFVWLLIAAVAAATAVPEPSDPLLLEYSDYYYDLYYGDYDNYDGRGNNPHFDQNYG